jgi:glutamate-ammonia-ligase adenylyltransferase
MTACATQQGIARARENSAYLRESLELYPGLAAQTLISSADSILESLYGEVSKEVLAHADEMAQLRILKRRAHMIIALADISNVWAWPEVTKALTKLADFALSRLLIAGAAELGIYSQDPDNPCPGLFILAMGKYGAFELNYSSDIDFCVFYDPQKLSLERPERAERTLIRFVQTLIRGFDHMTAQGYIFRTDLRLRPDPRSNAVAVSTATAERYYETLGQNWERAAMIKARVAGGDRDAGRAFIDNVLTPFIWRRSLDYAAIEDIHSIKRQIQARRIEGANGEGQIDPAGHHLKLGSGGIREIEFYAQTQQLILGGRNSSLRSPRTVDALAALAQGQFIGENEAQILTQHYGHLRRFEHAAQMREDAQTHDAPKDIRAREELAWLAGYDDLAAFDRALSKILTEVHQLYVALFPGFESLTLEDGNLSFTGVEPDPETLQTLMKLGFTGPSQIWRQMADWLGGRVSATRSERARALLTRLAPRLLKLCSQTGEANRAFEAFGSFFERLGSGVSLLAMFLQEPSRLRRVIDLMLISPRLSETLSSQPAVLDSMIDPRFLKFDIERHKAGYKKALGPDLDFEDSLNAARRQLREDQFRLAVSLLSHELHLGQAGVAFTQLAEGCIEGLLPASVRETERRIGPLGGDYAILAMGKLGGAEMSLVSDLDIMLIYEAPLRAQPDFIKLTQRLVSALSVTTAEGGLYEVDMALRPSGRSGPVAVSLEAFTRYYADRAWTWEFMALTRARVIAGSSEPFMASVSESVRQCLTLTRSNLNMPQDIYEMHQRLAREKPARGPWDVKQLPGTLRDAEFIAQALYLAQRSGFAGQGLCATQAMLSRAQALGALSREAYEDLHGAVRFFQNLTQALALTHGGLSGAPNIYVLSAAARVLGFENTDGLSAARERHIAAVKRQVKNFILR